MDKKSTRRKPHCCIVFSAWTVGGFAVMALVLGVVGLYRVIAYRSALSRGSLGSHSHHRRQLPVHRAATHPDGTGGSDQPSPLSHSCCRRNRTHELGHRTGMTLGGPDAITPNIVRRFAQPRVRDNTPDAARPPRRTAAGLLGHR